VTNVRNASGLSLELGEELEQRLTASATRVTICSKDHRHEVQPAVIYVSSMEAGVLTFHAVYGSAVDFCETCDEPLAGSVPLAVRP